MPCTTDPDPTANPPIDPVPAGCTPSHQTLFIPNITTDVGLSPPYNSLFTFFGQFFDHGVDQTVKSGSTVFVPLQADDPLITLGPDGKPNTGDEVKPADGSAFMVLTRAQNQPGPDGVLGTDDDIQNATNTDTPWVDQSQTYTSHASHQVFLREYVAGTGTSGTDNAAAVATGKLLAGLPAGQTYPDSPDGTDGESHLGLGQEAGARHPRPAAHRPGRHQHPDAGHRPVRQVPARAARSAAVRDQRPVSSRATSPSRSRCRPTCMHFDTPFVTDIAHNADPSAVDTNNDGVPDTVPDAGRRHHRPTDFAQAARRHLRRRDAQRARRLR